MGVAYERILPRSTIRKCPTDCSLFGVRSSVQTQEQGVDIRIILRTVLLVLRREAVVSGARAEMDEFWGLAGPPLLDRVPIPWKRTSRYRAQP